LLDLLDSNTIIDCIMPPKPSTSRGNLEDEEADVLQAVILADTFNKRFKPLTADRPKVLVLRTLPFYHLNGLDSVYFLYVMRLSWTGP
jgi:hypothetical protein